MGDLCHLIQFDPFWIKQCWTEGRSSTAVAKDFRPTATATVAEVLGHSYGRRKNLNFL